MAARVLDDPGWFAAVMGTGAVASVSSMNPGGIAALEEFATVVAAGLLAASVLFFLFLSVRAVVLRGRGPGLLGRMQSPLTGPAYATIPGAINVLTLGWIQVDPQVDDVPWSRTVVTVAAIAGTVAGLAVTVVFFAGVFHREQVEAEAISGTWFIPETVILLGALIFGNLAVTADQGWQRSWSVVAFATLGIGAILFALTAAVFFNRLVLYRQAERSAPALWIMLSPLSICAIALQAVARDTANLGGMVGVPVQQTAAFLAALLWGFSLWWFCVAVVITVRVGRLAVTWSPVDWGYVFPAGALVLSTLTLGRAWESGLVEAIGVVFAVVLGGFWLVVLGSAARSLVPRAAAA